MDLTEKVARAIFDAEYPVAFKKGRINAVPVPEIYMRFARAAIAVCAEEMAKRLDEEGYDCMGFCANTLRSIGATNA